jgi:N-acetylglucosaminyldiphosphoundecaprenol N-acetyl-beta-D-mannosaminyltransferase
VVKQDLKYQETENILGYPMTTLSKSDCIYHIVHWIENGSKVKYFVCANPHSLEVAEIDPVFDEAIRSADLIVPDGIGIVIASKILGGAIQDRVTGSDIFLGLSDRLNQKNGFSFFFLGSTEGNLNKIRGKMSHDFPNIKVAGVYSPPFKPEFSHEENLAMIGAINRAQPDVLWVGMTAPKQEKWIYENKEKLDVKFVGPVGAVFDFYAGNVKRSHPFFRKMGLEWLARFLQEPRRLWRRNLVSNPRFLLRVIGQRFNNR